MRDHEQIQNLIKAARALAPSTTVGWARVHHKYFCVLLQAWWIHHTNWSCGATACASRPYGGLVLRLQTAIIFESCLYERLAQQAAWKAVPLCNCKISCGRLAPQLHDASVDERKIVACVLRLLHKRIIQLTYSHNQARVQI